MSDMENSGADDWTKVERNRNRGKVSNVEDSAPRAQQNGGGDRKRKRRTTDGASQAMGNTSKASFHTLSVDEFKGMSTDDKLVAMFSAMQQMGLAEQKVKSVSQYFGEKHTPNRQNKLSCKLLEYRSLDLEARNRRNNLLFRDIPEVVGEDCC